MKHYYPFLLIIALFCISEKILAQQYTFEREISTSTLDPKAIGYNIFTDIESDEDGNTYFLDSENGMVRAFSNSGELISKWTIKGTENNQSLSYFSLFAYDAVSGYLYIFDSNNQLVKVHNKKGDLIKEWSPSNSSNYRNIVDIDIDEKGYIYLLENAFATSNIRKYDNSGVFIWEIGGEGNSTLFSSPTCMAISKSNGQLVVSDKDNSRLQFFNQTTLFFTKTFTPQKPKDGWFTGFGPNNYPKDIAFDPSGNLIVGDFFTNTIFKLSPNGTLLKFWNLPFSIYIQKIEVDKYGTLYLGSMPSTSQFDVRLLKYSNHGDPLPSFNIHSPQWYGIVAPNAIAVAADGSIFVTSNTPENIQKFNPDGSYKTNWNGGGKKDTELNDVDGIAVDKNGYIYVTDGWHRMVQKYTSEGQFILQWELPKSSQQVESRIIKIDTSGNIVIGNILGFSNGLYDPLLVYSNTGNLLNKIDIKPSTSNPYLNFAIDSFNNIYSIQADNCIRKHSSTGALISEWCQPTPLNFLENPDITIDSLGYVYIAYASVVKKYTRDMVFVTEFGSIGRGPGQFGTTKKITIDKNGKVYIADTQNNRIVTFVPDDYAFPIITAVQPAKDAYQILVYPNPSTGFFSLATDDTIEQVTVTDATGKQENFTSKEITTSLKGLLLIDIKSNKGRSVQKIIVH